MAPLRLSVLGLLGCAPGLFAAVSIVVLRVAMQLGAPLTAAAALCIPAFAAVVAVAVGPRRLRSVRVVRPGWAEVLTLLVLSGVLVLLWDRVADRSLLWPHTYGVDEAHHGGLVTAIVDTGRLPTATPSIGTLWTYPSGAHLLAAAAGRAMRWNPLAAMWFVGMSTVAMQVFAVAWLARLSAPRRSLSAALPAVAVWLLGWRLGFFTVSVGFWFSQTVSIVLALVGTGLCAVSAGGAAAGAVAARRLLLPIALVAAAVVLVYPQSAPLVPGAYVVSHLRLRHVGAALGAARRRWYLVAPPAAAVVAVLWWKVGGSRYATLRAIGGQGEGIVPKLTVASFGGIIVCALIIAGIAVLGHGALRGEPGAGAHLGAIAPPALLAGALWAAQRSGVAITRYRIVKNVYTMEPFLAAAAGVAATALVAALAGSSAGRRTRLLVVPPVLAAMVAVSFLARPQQLRITSLTLVDKDAYILARYAASTGDPNQYALAGDLLGPYVLWWAGLQRDAPTADGDLIPRMSRWDNWPDDGSPERYLIADATALPHYVDKQNVRVVARHGRAAILERVPPAP